MKNSAIDGHDSDSTLLFKITLVDGSTQLIPITEQQARTLGLQTEHKILEKTPVITSNVESVEAKHNEISDKIEDDKTSHFVYKIIKPEDLNLKPITKKHLSRGRPPKRRKQKTNADSPKVSEEAQKIVKQVRTRSGRITKPPKHIEKDFKKIDISDDIKNDLEKDLKIIEFQPLTTNATPKEEPLQYLEQHRRKRSISRHFRCPTCNKAYLGRFKMMSHIRKHPDHGPLPKYCEMIHNATWNFLLLTSQKYRDGEKGALFCQELDVLLQNARTLAQYLFKPVEKSDSGYFINENLAQVFGISVGNYKIDETELSRDISSLDYLENHEGRKNKLIDNGYQVKSEVDNSQPYSNINTENGNDSCLDSDVPVSFKSFEEYMLQTNEAHVPNYENRKINYNDGISNIQKNGINISNINPQQLNHPNIEFPISNTNQNIIIAKDNVKNDCADMFLNTQNSQNSIRNGDRSAVVKFAVQEKHAFNFDNHPFENINNDLDNVMDTNHLENLGNYHNVNVKGSVFDIHSRKTDGTAQHVPEKHNSHITLQNALHDVDDLILVNDSGLILTNDTAQVSNLLDASSNSDDIMNVDQFVNERFKKLTEHTDIDIQNNILNIELPPLDIFHFDTS